MEQPGHFIGAAIALLARPKHGFTCVRETTGFVTGYSIPTHGPDDPPPPVSAPDADRLHCGVWPSRDPPRSRNLDLNPLIQDVPDWPKPGIVFKDITPLLRDPAGLAMAVEQMANPFRGKQIELVAGAESRGFIFGTAIAQALSAGFVPIRKPRKLPRRVHAIEYELEYGTDRLEVHADAIARGQRVLLVDDLLATGGTMEACCRLMQNLGADLVGITVLIELAFLTGRRKLDQYGELHAVLQYS
ncbi:MAG: adenine phosphoribosyltransferase [Phycisphaeraceae bacterium]|nr:adenine phosphoribosyltransferase [Phycisphaeraceae bacterium]